MLIPTSFGQFTGTYTAPDGSVQTFTQPPTYKGRVQPPASHDDLLHIPHPGHQR